MGGGIPKPAQSSEGVDHVSEGARKYERNDAGPWSNVTDGGAVSAIIFQQELVGDWVYDQGLDGVPPSGGTTDHRYYGKTRGRRRVGVPISKGGDGIRGYPPHRGVHQD